MNRAKKVIALTMALTGGLWVYSYASPGDAQTYVSRSRLENLQPEKSQGFSFTQLMQDSSPDSVRTQGTNTAKTKEPYKAFLYALVPGAVVHGAGHFYARKVGTGFILLGCELTGAALVYLGTVTGVESGEPSPGGTVAVATGAALFLGSWACDAVFAPLSIKRQNEELLREKRTRLELRLKNGDVRLVTVFRF
jgi:hypothetical protein